MVFRDPAQTGWLIDLLREQGVFVIVHVDAKQQALYRPLAMRYATQTGVHVVAEPVAVNWAGFSQVQASLRGIEWALANLPAMEYLHLMSGECLPLRPLADCEPLFERAGGQDLIECRLRPGYEWRINRYNILGEHPRNREHWHNRAFKLVRELQRGLPPRRNVPADGIYFGSQWWSLRTSSLRRMLGSVDLPAFCRRFAWTRCADEHFFQILHHRVGLRAGGHHRHDRFDGSIASPAYLSLAELQEAFNRGCLFARKVRLDVMQQYARVPAGHAVPTRLS